MDDIDETWRNAGQMFSLEIHFLSFLVLRKVLGITVQIPS